MFRPNPEQTLFGQIPVRLIMSIILIFAVVLTVVLVLGIEREKNVVEGLVKAQELTQAERTAFLKSREDLLFVTLALFLISGVGVGMIVTYQSYHATRKTLEQVKGLARSILYSLPTGVLTIDRQGSVTAVNPFAERILDVRAGEMLGRSFYAVFPEKDPVRGILQTSLERGAHVKDQDIPYPSPSGPDATIRLSTSELKDVDQTSAGVVVLLQDISELIFLEQQLRRSDKLSALHTLSAGIAHEIRNPLSAMDLNLHLLNQETLKSRPDSKEIVHYIDILNAEIQRLKTLVDNFMRFSKSSPIQLQEVGIYDVIHHLTQLLQYEAREKGITIRTRFPERPVEILGDETQLSQAFLNILINAFQATDRGGEIRIEVRSVRKGNAEMAEVLITDTGAGIPRSELSRLFEPFYTTKKEGSGLGLPIAHRIIEDHHGTIEIDSIEGKGTTVRIRVPCQTVGEEVKREPV